MADATHDAILESLQRIEAHLGVLPETVQAPVSFQDWRTAGNDQVINWPAFQGVWQEQVNLRRQATPLPDGNRTERGSMPGGAAFAGGVALLDGRVYMVPYTSATARIYDPATNAISTPGGSFPSGKFQGGVLLKDGRVFIVPRTSATARIYAPATDTLTTPGGTYPISDAFYGGVLLPDGRVFMVPGAWNDTPYIYDPIADTVATVAGFPSGVHDPFYSGVLLPEGSVFCVPRNITSAVIYHMDGTVESVSGFPALADSYYGGVLLPDGKVACIPGRAEKIAIFDPATRSVSFSAATFPVGASKFVSGSLTPDGRVICSARNVGAAWVWDPVTDSAAALAGGYGNDSVHHSSVLMVDGDTLLVPTNGTMLYTLATGHAAPLDPLLITSPFFNKL